MAHERMEQESTRESILEPYVTDTPWRTLYSKFTCVPLGHRALHRRSTCNDFVTFP
ncbi:hypothetical protein U2A4042490036 [Corynebacterium striatum]|nr:hypothetical protein U2A4042490036 [Corynebacterium striatum]